MSSEDLIAAMMAILLVVNAAVLCTTDKADVVVVCGMAALFCGVVCVARLDEWAEQTWGEDR